MKRTSLFGAALALVVSMTGCVIHPGGCDPLTGGRAGCSLEVIPGGPLDPCCYYNALKYPLLPWNWGQFLCCGCCENTCCSGPGWGRRGGCAVPPAYPPMMTAGFADVGGFDAGLGMGGCGMGACSTGVCNMGGIGGMGGFDGGFAAGGFAGPPMGGGSCGANSYATSGPMSYDGGAPMMPAEMAPPSTYALPGNGGMSVPMGPSGPAMSPPFTIPGGGMMAPMGQPTPAGQMPSGPMPMTVPMRQQPMPPMAPQTDAAPATLLAPMSYVTPTGNYMMQPATMMMPQSNMMMQPANGMMPPANNGMAPPGNAAKWDPRVTSPGLLPAMSFARPMPGR